MSHSIANAAYRKLERSLGYRFDNRSYLEIALTHKSANREVNYEVLEFLGDRALSMVIPELLREHYPHAAEGELTRMYQLITRNSNLAFMATRLRLSSYVQMSDRYKRHQPDKLLADVVEAVFGALKEDGDVAVVRRVARKIFRTDIAVAQFEQPLDKLQALVERDSLGLVRLDFIPRRGNGRQGPHWDLVVLKLHKRGEKPRSIAEGRGYSLEQAANHAAAFALFALDKELSKRMNGYLPSWRISESVTSL